MKPIRALAFTMILSILSVLWGCAVEDSHATEKGQNEVSSIKSDQSSAVLGDPNEESPATAEGQIEVLSNYPYLTSIVPGYFEDTEDTHRNDGVYARYQHMVYVSMLGEKLCVISNMISDGNRNVMLSTSEQYHCGKLVGTAFGVYTENGDLLIEGACKGLITYDSTCEKMAVLIQKDGCFTVYYLWDTLAQTEVENFIISEGPSFAGNVELFCVPRPGHAYDPCEETVVVTDQKIYLFHTERLSTGEGDPLVKTITPPDWWQRAWMSNIVRAEDGVYYIGEYLGVIRVDVNTDQITYYPVDHLDAIYGNR